MAARLLFVVHRPQIGGAETVILNTLSHLDRARFRLSVLGPAPGPIAERLDSLGVSYVTHSMPKMPRGAAGFVSCGLRHLAFSRWLAKYLESEGVDLVHANTVFSQLWAGRAARAARTPVVWHVQEILRPGRRNGFLLRFGAAHADRVLAASDAVRRSLLSFGVPDEKIVVIHNGLNPKGPFRPDLPPGALRRTLGLPASRPIVLMPAMLTHWKGQHVFLEAASQVAALAPEPVFVLVGDALVTSDRPYADELRDMARKQGLEGRFLFAGLRSDMAEVVADADMVVHASIWEDPLPTVVIEAMAMGKPIVASDVGGVRELIEDGVSGRILPAGDVPALRDELLRLLGDPDLRRRLGGEARQRFLERFTVDRYMGRLESLYEDVLRRARARV